MWYIPRTRTKCGPRGVIKGSHAYYFKHMSSFFYFLPQPGIGGLSNSCAPWLRSYDEKSRSDILDVLFKPRWAGAAQVLKLEIGGDAHSTINTESSHMHVQDPSEMSFQRGWETWMALEAKKRNPDIKIGGLSWGSFAPQACCFLFEAARTCLSVRM